MTLFVFFLFVSAIASHVMGSVQIDTTASVATVIPKLNLTAATAVNGATVIQCWQLDVPSTGSNNLAEYRIGDFVNTTIFTAPAGSFEGHTALTYSIATIITGAVKFNKVDYTLEPGRDSNLILATIGANSPLNNQTTIEGPIYLLQQYSDQLPSHSVLHNGACKGQDLPA